MNIKPSSPTNLEDGERDVGDEKRESEGERVSNAGEYVVLESFVSATEVRDSDGEDGRDGKRRENLGNGVGSGEIENGRVDELGDSKLVSFRTSEPNGRISPGVTDRGGAGRRGRVRRRRRDSWEVCSAKPDKMIAIEADNTNNMDDLPWGRAYGGTEGMLQDVHRCYRYGYTALHFATRYELTESIRNLIEAKANVNARAKLGTTAVFIATRGKNLENIKLLVGYGADINIPCDFGQTPLIEAALRIGDTEVAEYLISLKAHINAINHRGETALLTAAAKGRMCLVEMLLEAKADVNITNIHNETALMWSLWNNHYKLALYLASKGARLGFVCKENRTAIDCTWDEGVKAALKTWELHSLIPTVLRHDIPILQMLHKLILQAAEPVSSARTRNTKTPQPDSPRLRWESIYSIEAEC